MYTLKTILDTLEKYGIKINEKESAELISHDVLVGAHYYKQLKKRQRALSAIEDYDKETVGYLRIALNLCGLAVGDHATEVIINAINTYLEKGGKMSVDDASEIITRLEQKYKT